MKRGNYKFILVVALTICLLNTYAQVTAGNSKHGLRNHPDFLRSISSDDSLHANHYRIFIDSINFLAQTIRAKAEIHLVAKVADPVFVNLDLLQLSVDSVFLNGQPALYSYNDTTISIPITAPMSAGDTMNVRIHYSGMPKQDPSGWGGFYISGLYAFNLGVGFQSVPHNLGKVWFPCIDVFTDKATYEFFITTAPANKAFANGELVSETLNPDGTKTWYWNMTDPIPTYLACMAVGPYYTKTTTSNGIPVEWACLAADTVKVSNTFQHLDTIVSAYINAYGAYPFQKIGYLLVPFNSGAMEHATAISIGRAFINGTLTYETLWAHELAHMWWGDKVTCKTAQDMWLNEGWASYNEGFVTQLLYGQQMYKNWNHTNHRQLVQFAHVPQNDSTDLAMNNIPDNKTYGMHVYQKGADIIHTMRNYMGDSSFFNGCKYYLNNRAYGNASSEDLRDDLTAGSGINMSRFFDDWIFTPGWPHFSIDSVVYVPGGLDHYFVYTRQRSRGNNHIYKMPVELTFSSPAGDTTLTILIDSVTNVFHIPLIQTADWIMLDRNQKVSDAIVDFEKDILSTGIQQFTETGFSMNVQQLGNPAPPLIKNTFRVEHHYVTPDGFQHSNPGIRISDYHYWSVNGRNLPGFLSKATFSYDGSTSLSNGYLDNNLITGVEDSVVILYRKGVGDDWEVVNGFTQVIGSASDKRGTITVDTLKFGEYVFGYYDYSVSNQQVDPVFFNKMFTVNPNPASTEFRFERLLAKDQQASLKIFDCRGTIVFDSLFKDCLKWEVSNIPAGIYFANLIEKGKVRQTEKLVVLK
ncbi:MAG: T9SS type A sorting domain-containing protein [Bacteroidia bacterium]|nr:T9SS type A sorting domain-containing protein [Bacteroidia bacterium]